MKNSQSKRIVNYDAKADILYIGLKKGIEEEFVEISPEVSVELDEKGKILGFEVLNASRVFQSVADPLQKQAMSQMRQMKAAA